MSNSLPQVGFDYDQIPAGYYDAIACRGRGTQKYWHQYKFERLIEQIQLSFPNHREKPVKIVDFGCGPGTFLGTMSKRMSIDGVGVDIAKPQVDYANQTYGGTSLKFIHGSMESPEVKEAIQDADVVSLIEIIEHLHLREIKETLDRLRAMMRPGSMPLVTTPNYLSLWPLLELIVSYSSEVNYEEQHITKLNRVRLRMLLRACGFEDIQMASYLQISPFVAGIFGSKIGSLARMIENRFFSHGGPLLWALVRC